MNQETKVKIKSILIETLRNKLENYRPETNAKPFHTRLLGQDRMALFSFIHSLNTTFGTSIFEPVAKELALSNFDTVKTHYDIGRSIVKEAQETIQSIINSLSASVTRPNKNSELRKIYSTLDSNIVVKTRTPLVDIYLEKDNEIYLIDLKTVKPNRGNFIDFKRRLLEWAAICKKENPTKEVKTYLGLPYNPYEPRPYERWTMAGIIDVDNELLIADQLWDFIGGAGAYNDLLYCFEEVGIFMTDEIDKYFAKYNS